MKARQSLASTERPGPLCRLCSRQKCRQDCGMVAQHILGWYVSAYRTRQQDMALALPSIATSQSSCGHSSCWECQLRPFLRYIHLQENIDHSVMAGSAWPNLEIRARLSSRSNTLCAVASSSFSTNEAESRKRGWNGCSGAGRIFDCSFSSMEARCSLLGV